MPWPDLFWKSKKPKAPQAVPAPEASKATATEPPQPPTIKPVPATATVTGPNVTPPAAPVAVPTPVAAPIPVPGPVKAEPKAEVTATRTIPAQHGVVLRPPTGRTVQASASIPQIQPPRAMTPPKPPEPMKNIEQLMAEADPVQTLRQTGNVRILAPLSASVPETGPLEPPQPAKAIPTPTKIKPIRPAPVGAIPPAAHLAPVPTPAFRPAVTVPFTHSRKIEPSPAKPAASIPVPKVVPTPAPVPLPPSAEASPVPPPEDSESPFILKSTPVETAPAPSVHDGATKILPPAAVPAATIGSIFRRKARMADVARIVLPPKREDTQILRPAPSAAMEPAPTVVPPAFPVAAMTARATQALPKAVPVPEEMVTDSQPATPPPFAPVDHEPFILTPETAKPVDRSQAVDVAPAGIIGMSNTELPALDQAFDFVPPGHQEPTIVVPPAAPIAPVSEAKPIEPLLHTDDAPRVDPEAHQPAPSTPPEPKLDPEAHKPEITVEEIKPAQAIPVEPVQIPPASAAALRTSPAPPEKREFHLANGERVSGIVISESPDAIYIEHGTLGVVTIPRANIAKRLVEIILVNGDRIVGDILAETADTLYVKHASLGMLTVPRAARSTRVVEAILKDGDRILGEVLTETDTFTVIRSASLGTITVPHSKLAMLNRKVEQIELKALPPVAELKAKA